MDHRLFYIEAKTGEMTLIEHLDPNFSDKNQLLQLVGIDSEPIYQGSVQTADSSWTDLNNIIFSKFLSIDNSEELQIVVGDFIVNSIKRLFPEIEYEFVVTNSIDNLQRKLKFDNYILGFKILINNPTP